MRSNLSKSHLLSGCLVALLLLPAVAFTAVPGQLSVQGVLRGVDGTPVVSGKYGMKVNLYPDAKGASLWSETLLGVEVSGGAFGLTLGASEALTPALLSQAAAAHIGIQVDADPELPRVPLRSVAFALHAATAAGLQCSGCVKTGQLAPESVSGDAIALGTVSAGHVGFTYAGAKTKGGPAELALDLKCSGCVGLDELKIDGVLDLGGNALKAKQVAASVVTAASFVGDGSQLTGIQSISGDCAIGGQVVKGIKADGSLVCAQAVELDHLPPDGLDEISNGLLSNQFVNAFANPAKVKIPDNNPIGTVSSLNVPDVGTAQTLVVKAHVTTSDLAQLEVQVIDPKKALHVLHLKSGSGKSLHGIWPKPDKLVSGDLSAWIGNNPVGVWHLKAIDHKTLGGGDFDGQIEGFTVEFGTVSNKKVEAKGLLLANGGFKFKLADAHPVVCDDGNFGYTYANPKDKALYICNGKEFYPVNLIPVGTADNPGKSCKDVLKKMPASKSGMYWINVAGGTTQMYCNMNDHDGGWTLAARMVGNSWCHIDAKSVGTLGDPSQAKCAKLSDAAIRALYTERFWLSCGSKDPWRFGAIDDIKNFNTDPQEGNKKMTWSMTYGGKTHSGTDHTCCNFGDHNYHTPNIIYSIAKGYSGGNYTKDWSGCHNGHVGWHQSGFLYVR